MKLPVDHLSSSQVTISKMCMRLLRYVEVERRRQRPDSLRAKGKAVHGVAAADLTHRRDTGRLMPEEQIVDLAASHFATESYEVDWRHEDEDPGAAKDQTIGMARAHHAILAPTIRPLHVEHRMERRLAGLPLTLLGFADVIEGAADAGPMAIRDLKSSKEAPDGANKGKPKRNEKYVPQLATYLLLFAAEANSRSVSTAIDYVWPTKGGQAIPAPMEITRNDVRLALEDYAGLIKVYEAGVFPRTGRGSWVCTVARCAFFAECILGRSRALDV
jgi:hypothetical protein